MHAGGELDVDIEMGGRVWKFIVEVVGSGLEGLASSIRFNFLR